MYGVHGFLSLNPSFAIMNGPGGFPAAIQPSRSATIEIAQKALVGLSERGFPVG